MLSKISTHTIDTIHFSSNHIKKAWSETNVFTKKTEALIQVHTSNFQTQTFINLHVKAYENQTKNSKSSWVLHI